MIGRNTLAVGVIRGERERERDSVGKRGIRE